jgi:uncharacterized protein YecE (DUF72 family)
VGAVRIGISGWRYAGWRGVFYPKGLAHRRELEYASRAFESVEINGSFYSLQRPEFYRDWSAQTPDGFVFAVKGSRFITHMKKLRDVATPLANFFASGVLALGDKLGPFLWQLPPIFRFDAASEQRLARFFDLLPRDTEAAATLARRHDRRVSRRSWLRTDRRRPLRHAVEVRHDSFRTPRFLRLLREHAIGLVVADTAGRWPLIEAVTADFVYVRLHGDEELYVSGYTPEALDAWAARIRRWRRRRDVYVYFDNDAKVHAPFDALALEARIARRRDLPRVHPGHGGEPARIGWPEIAKSRRKRSPRRRFSGSSRDAIGARSRA